jgi:hypothetical protein
MTDEEINRGLEAWKVTVEVQQHFNDIEMKIRNYALTLLLAVAAAAGVALRENRPGLAIWILVAGLVAWAAFYFMDEWWYHRLLIGAVKHGLELEDELRHSIPGIGLSNSIKNASAIHVGFGKEESGGKRWTFDISSTWKIRIFYGVIAIIFLIAIIAVASIDEIGQRNGIPSTDPSPSPTASIP